MWISRKELDTNLTATKLNRRHSGRLCVHRTCAPKRPHHKATKTPPPPPGTHWKGGRYPPPPHPGRPACAQPPSPWRQMPASRAFVTNSNRPLWQPPPTACLTAAGAAFEVPSLLMHPCFPPSPPLLRSRRPHGAPAPCATAAAHAADLWSSPPHIVYPKAGNGSPQPPAPPKRQKWRRAQKVLLRRTTGKSHIGELAPMALCDIHVAGCGEHLPAWGLCDDRILGTDQAVRGGRHGQKLHCGFPPQAGGCLRQCGCPQ